MVARDPLRKRTLSAHPEFDGKKKGADRWSDPHVGSTVSVTDDPVIEEGPHVAGRSTSEPADEKKKG